MQYQLEVVVFYDINTKKCSQNKLQSVLYKNVYL